MKAEIRSLTGIRGLAALTVVLYHYTRPGRFLTEYAPNLILHGYIAVDLFFVLSGFILTLTYRSLFEVHLRPRAVLEFLVKRFARIYPAYFAISALHLAVLAMFGTWVFDRGDIACNVFMCQGWGFGFRYILHHSWSLSTEVVAYLCFPLFILTTSGRTAFKLVFAVGSLMAIALVTRSGLGLNGPLDVVSSTSFYPLARCLSGFVFGMLAFYLVSYRPIWEAVSTKVISNSLLAASLLVVAVYPGDGCVYSVLPLLVVLAYVDKSWPRALFGNAVVYWLGVVSYSAFLLHPLFIGWAQSVAAHLSRRLGITSGEVCGLLFGVAATSIVSVISYHLVEAPCRTSILTVLRQFSRGQSKGHVIAPPAR